jgi:integrase
LPLYILLSLWASACTCFSIGARPVPGSLGLLWRGWRPSPAACCIYCLESIAYPRFCVAALRISLRTPHSVKDDFLDWRDRLRPGRLPRTVNRFVRAVTAGLNRAHGLGHIGNPAAWRIEALADDASETAVFLSPAQRKGLIDSASPEAAAFLRGLELSGARPKELAETMAADFDGERLRLSHRKGRPPKLRSRYVILDQDGVAFFRSWANGKSATDRLFTAAEGKPWRRDMWAQEVRSAIASHNKRTGVEAPIPGGASAYSFRHAQISELLQVYGADPLTVAGTK